MLWVILAVGGLLRLSTLGVQSFWLDEAISYWTVNRSLDSLLELLEDGTRPLFFYVLYPFSLLGEQEWVLRLPAALLGILGLWLIYLLGRELFDRPTGLLAAALLALSPLHLWYSQEVRFYAMVSVVSMSAILFMVRGLKHNRSLDWVLFGLFLGLGLWTESGGIWLILAVNLVALLLVRLLFQDWRFMGWGLAMVMGVITYLPRLAAFASSVQGDSASWIPPATVRYLLIVLSDFAGGFMQPAWFGILSLLGIGLSLLLGAVWLLRDARPNWLAYAVLLPWMVVPISASFVISQPYYRPDWLLEITGSRPSVFLTRNLITILFPLLLLAARSLRLMYEQPQDLWRRVGISLGVGLLALYSVGYFNNHLTVRKEDYRSAVNLLVQEMQPGDLLLTSPTWIEEPVAYYYYVHHFEELHVRDLSLESLRDGVVDRPAFRQDLSLRAEIEDDLLGLIEEHERVWLVTNNNINQPPNMVLLQYLRRRASLEQAAEFNGVIVELYVFPAAGANIP
jgi:mannosyltransferase